MKLKEIVIANSDYLDALSKMTPEQEYDLKVLMMDEFIKNGDIDLNNGVNIGKLYSGVRNKILLNLNVCGQGE